MINIAGEHFFNEVFSDNVRVPGENMIGQKNMGFYYLMTALGFERLLVGIGGFRFIFERFLDYIKTTERDGVSLGKDPLVRWKMAEIAIKIETAYLFFWRTAEMLDKDQIPSVESSALKLLTTELSRKMADVFMEILLYYRKAKAGEIAFGDGNHHLEKVASSQSFPNQGRFCKQRRS